MEGRLVWVVVFRRFSLHWFEFGFLWRYSGFDILSFDPGESVRFSNVSSEDFVVLEVLVFFDSLGVCVCPSFGDESFLIFHVGLVRVADSVMACE